MSTLERITLYTLSLVCAACAALTVSAGLVGLSIGLATGSVGAFLAARHGTSPR